VVGIAFRWHYSKPIHNWRIKVVTTEGSGAENVDPYRAPGNPA